MLTALRRILGSTSTATVTNPLDEQKQQIVDRDEGANCSCNTMTRLQGQRQYVVKPRSLEERHEEVAGRSLSGGHWDGGRDARRHSYVNGVAQAALGTEIDDSRSI